MSYGRPGVYVNETLTAVSEPLVNAPTANAAGAVVGAFAQGPSTLTLVTSWFDFVKLFGGYNANYPATFGVGQFFLNGGSELYVQRVLHSDAAAASVLVTRGTGSGTVATVTAKAKGDDGNNLRVKLTAAARGGSYFDLVVTKETVSGTSSDITNDVVLENYNNVVFDAPTSPDYVETVVNFYSPYITISVADNTNAPTTSVLPLTAGANGTAATVSDYTAVVAVDGSSPFDVISRPLVIFAPEITKVLGDTDGASVQNALTAWAATGDGFAVLDVPSGKTPAAAITYASGLTASAKGAVYYPSLYIQDPIGRSSQAVRLVGPAGAVAGLYLATDRAYGPYKAPAGLNSGLVNVVALERSFTSANLDSLNSASKPVNAIRNLPGAGFVVMGARTLKQNGTADRYVNMRRSLTYIRNNLKSLTQFAIFENNDSKLWASIITTLGVFLNEYRNAGGLSGGSAPAAFYVKCDSTNNTPQTIANGEVHIEVGVALEYPTEFVVINLSQKTLA
jgi:phage tail sheath protein FI